MENLKTDRKGAGEMTQITENLKTEVVGRYDVAVCGGGIAGISAALAAARGGASVLLTETSYILGGLATSGLVTVYLPLCDGFGRQVSFGICEELIRLSAKHGLDGDYDGAEWFSANPREKRTEHRFEVQYNPHFFAIDAEQLLKSAGVDILYGTKVCGVKTENKSLTHIIIENKSGRSAVAVGAAVDATGDADIFWYAGAKTDTFKAKNVLACWYYFEGKKGAQLKMLGYSEDPRVDKTETLTDRRFTGLDGKDNSEMVQLAHDRILEDIERAGVRPVTLPTIPQLRMTRKLVGKYELDAAEAHKRFESSIGMISDWRERGPVYEIPFETLCTDECVNVFAAGRCISVTDLMWDISRVIPACAVTGEASGAAAALAAKNGGVDLSALQKILMRGGAVLHEDELD